MAKKKIKKLSLSKKLDVILQKEEQVLRRESAIAAEEKKEDKEEKKIEFLEEQELSEIRELEKLEKEIKNQIKEHPLKKIGGRDVIKGLAGGFAGVIVHNALYYGTAIAGTFDNFRAIMWFFLAFIMGGILLYASGYRKVEDKKTLWIIPLRLTILYCAALVVSIAALFLYSPGFGSDVEKSMHLLAAVQMSATIGAVTADMLGRE
ncbi:MAG: hypothetical protein AABX51_06210 [Nanoarchaeota archaeon]